MTILIIGNLSFQKEKSMIRFLLSNSNAEENNFKYFSEDLGVLSIMYHRFDENKYPSTNIRMNVFKDQMNMII